MSDFAIAGAGIIGLSLALELHSRGASVAILDTHGALGGASRAAAGMLAASDPHNPAQLRELSAFSMSLYDGFLARLSELSGLDVPYQTTSTREYLDDGSVIELAEKSVDPRQLGAAALAAVLSSGIALQEQCGEIAIHEAHEAVTLAPVRGTAVRAGQLLHASGAWFSGPPAVQPRKGQMLRVQIPAAMKLDQVHRSASIYVVPRTHGPQKGTALIGATEEDAGFDLRTHALDLAELRRRAAILLPTLADHQFAPEMEAWAGLRPATVDCLPVLGRLRGSARQWIAGGHYRNGILLAPGTAAVMSDLIEGKQPAVTLDRFDPLRQM